MSITDWITAVSSAVTGLATVVIMVWAGLQWYEMHTGGTQTEKIISAANGIEGHQNQLVLDNKQALTDNRTALANVLQENRDELAKVLRQNREATIAQTHALNGQLAATQKGTEVAERPWVFMDGLTLTKPLQFTSAAGLLAFKYNLRNAGRTPAIFVSVQSELLPVNLITYSGEEFTELLIRQCKPTPQMEDTATSFPGDPRIPVFPTDTIQQVQRPEISKRGLESGWADAQSKRHAPLGSIQYL